MNLSISSLQRDFFNAKGLSHSGGCGTRPSAFARRAQTSAPSEYFHVRIPKMLKLPWLKSQFAREIASFIFGE